MASENKIGVLSSPAAERNKGAILDQLERLLPAQGLVLEIASGTGQHVVHFAAAFPNLQWQPTEIDGDSLVSVHRRREAAGLHNIAEPVQLDVLEHRWPVERADAVMCINMIHIAPWAAAEGLFRGSQRILAPGARLILYGPYRRNGRHTAPSNEAFDTSLRARNPEWGVRELEDVEGLAAQCDFAPLETVAMPANNLIVVFERR